MAMYIIFAIIVFGLILWVAFGAIGQIIWKINWSKTYNECLGYLYGPLVFVQMLSTYPWLREE